MDGTELAAAGVGGGRSGVGEIGDTDGSAQANLDGVTDLRDLKIAALERELAAIRGELRIEESNVEFVEQQRDAAEASRRAWAEEALKWLEYTGADEDTAKGYDWLVAFGPEHMDFARVCACVSDAEADRLTAAGFSRPVCAVHEEESA